MADTNANDQEAEQKLYDKIHRKTWAHRFQGMVAGLTHFGIYGAIIGVVAGLLPFALSAAGFTTGVALPASMALNVASKMAIFACSGMFMGMITGADVAANAGSSTAILHEIDTKLEAAGLSKGATPEAEPQNAKPENLYSWKVAAFYAPAAALVGALASLSTLTAAPVALLGFQAGTPAAAIAFAVIFGMIGNYYAVKNSIVSNKFKNMYSKISEGVSPLKAIESQLVPELQQETEPAIEPLNQQKLFAADMHKFSLQGILDHSEDKSAGITIS